MRRDYVGLASIFLRLDMAPNDVVGSSDSSVSRSIGGVPMGVDYGWEKFFGSVHYAVTSTELLQKRLQVVVSGIDGLRRDSFPSDETYERFEKLMTATKMLPARGNEGRLVATTSQMEESEAKQWLQEAVAIFSDVAQAYGKERARPTSFPTYPKTRS
jgi:hypothetical protein